jgi:SAM-dependent methyltransferase
LRRAFNILAALRHRKVREHAWQTVQAYRDLRETECSCCGYVGKFDSFGLDKLRMGANCPQCESKERHRLLALAILDDFVGFADQDVLHLAPEPIVGAMVRRNRPSSYVTADIAPGCDLRLDIEHMELPDDSFDRVICSHVLEHVNDAAALAEIRRILRSSGYAILMVPIIEGWSGTYEDSTKTSAEQRAKYFGQHDHVRFYGADFRDRVRAARLDLYEYTAGPEASPRYGLMRGEKVFKATRA